MIEYSTELAESICVRIAAGDTLEEISAEPGFPARGTVYRWLARYPKFFEAYERAREVSAQSLEEQALLLAKKLTGPNDFTAVKVQAYRVALEQLRWSAARRDKARFGQQMPTAAPLQINISSTLNLEAGAPVDDTAKSIYTIEAIVTPVSPEEDLDIEPQIDDTEDREALAFAPTERGSNELVVKKPRRKPGHKSAADTLRTARRFATQEAKRTKGKG